MLKPLKSALNQMKRFKKNSKRIFMVHRQEIQKIKMKLLKIVFTFQIWLSKRAIIIH